MIDRSRLTPPTARPRSLAWPTTAVLSRHPTGASMAQVPGGRAEHPRLRAFA
jgi:hypothetical protein